MRLLSTASLELEFFQDSDVPQYAILSHTWAEGEVSFDALAKHGDLTQLKGWDKIQRSCAVAASLGLAYIWVDTCCIDKASSSELSEAINSMFRWYEHAQLCIAFLADVASVADAASPGSAFRKSRWFTRGWTLQELIAPAEVLFYGADWTRLGTRESLKTPIRDITGVPEDILETQPAGGSRQRRRLDELSVAQRMSWAARRTTTRVEDVAYSLLGIFDINMPLLYGEGQAKAFKRLQEEIIKSTDDESLYAWRHPTQAADAPPFWGLLADSPAAFGNYDDMPPMRSRYLSRLSGGTAVMTNRGLRLDLPVTPFPKDPSGTIFLAFLNCELRRERSTSSLAPAILIQKMSWDNDSDVVRIRPDLLALSMMNHVVLPDELAAMMGGSASGDQAHQATALAEPVPRQIFVPHNCAAARPPSGIIFDPQAGIARQGIRVPPARVVSRSPTWQYFASPTISQSGELYEVDFNLVPVPEVGDLRGPKVFGVLELEIDTRGGPDPLQCCLVVGLEPLQPNPFDTPALYFVPWAAFEPRQRIAEGWFEHVLDKRSRQTLIMDLGRMADVDWKIEAVTGLERRYARLFYRLSLTAEQVKRDRPR